MRLRPTHGWGHARRFALDLDVLAERAWVAGLAVLLCAACLRCAWAI